MPLSPIVLSLRTFHRLVKTGLKLFFQLALVVAIFYLGDSLATFIPMPANILGMLLLLSLLLTGILQARHIHEGCAFLLKYMAIFFLPASVSLMGQADLLQQIWFKFAFVCFVTTLLVFATTALTVASVSRVLQNKKRERL